jgi:hypothetical protein
VRFCANIVRTKKYERVVQLNLRIFTALW